MREIGSEFWDAPVVEKNNGLFPKCTQWYLSGRSALQAIISDLKEARSVSLPSWCCESIIKPFLDAGMDVHFYPVYWKDRLVQEINFDSDVLFLMDYFGYKGQQPDLNGYDGWVIRDVTHSIFSSSFDDADYYFGSLRKWCGVYTGGYAWTIDGHQLAFGREDVNYYVSLRQTAMREKKAFLDGIRNDKDYLRIFNEAEEYLDSVGIVPAAEYDIYIAEHIDVYSLIERRKANANILRKAFPDWLLFSALSDSEVPMFVPVLVPEGMRDSLRKFLISNDIYCPIHWPVSEYHSLDERASYIYKNELSLVCDQRYFEEDIMRMVDLIRSFMEEQ